MRDVLAVLSAALSTRYRVERELGAGGMARVYLARDLKHDRDVALKVLRDEVAAVVGVDRFLAEIRTTARLKHPHILPLFDSGSADGVLFYVMPFVDGESLRARVRREGALPAVEAVRILRQIADAIAYAHRQGVLHCDIKTDNVMLANGHAFLADFGIARAFAVHDPGATATAAGLGIGTPAYMSPEQIVGGAVDRRADIYALGALAYEALTGAPPFGGSAPEIAAAHLTRSPEPINRLRSDVPPALADLVMRCLAKAPEDRPQRADDVLAALEASAVHASTAGATPHAATRRWALVAVVSLLVIVAIGARWYRLRTPDKAATLTTGRLTHVTTDPGLELDPALSPDGRMLAYAAGVPGQTRIYIRELGGGRAVPLTDDASVVSQRWPQWSPDGSRILFQAGAEGAGDPSSISAAPGNLYVATPLSGSARKLPPSIANGDAISASWSPDGSSIVFACADGLYTAGIDGSQPRRRLAAGYDLHSPRWSPDRQRIAFVSRGSLFTFGNEKLGNVGTSVLMVLTLATGRASQITDGSTLDTNPAWMPDGRTLIFVSSRGGGRDLYAVPVTPDGRTEAQPQRLTSGVSAHGVSVARDGQLLLYSSYTPNANVWSVRIPENGTVSVSEAQQVTFGNEKIEKLAVSPDGEWLAYDSDVTGVANVWKLPLAGGRPEQITHGPSHKFVNAWSPDGRELVYHSIQDGQRDLFVVSADGTRTERVTTGPAEEQHAGWSPDGNSIVFDSAPPGSNISNAFIVTRAQRGGAWSAPRRVTNGGSGDPKWSPDGHLIAFCVDGQLRVIAPDGTGERAIVQQRGRDDPEPEYPLWSRDGRTLYYKAYDRERHSTIWAVPISGGPPRLVVRFDVPALRSLRREFATDGRRFYFNIARDESDLWAIEMIGK